MDFSDSELDKIISGIERMGKDTWTYLGDRGRRTSQGELDAYAVVTDKGVKVVIEYQYGSSYVNEDGYERSGWSRCQLEVDAKKIGCFGCHTDLGQRLYACISPMRELIMAKEREQRQASKNASMYAADEYKRNLLDKF